MDRRAREEACGCEDGGGVAAVRQVVAAYRDRYQITDDTPLGTVAGSDAQKIDAARAETALKRAKQLSQQPPDTEQPDLTIEPGRAAPSESAGGATGGGPVRRARPAPVRGPGSIPGPSGPPVGSAMSHCGPSVRAHPKRW